MGPDFVNVVVRPEMRAVMRTVFGQYKPDEIYTTQKAIQERVKTLSKTHLEARFVSLDDVPIESITLLARISEAIEAKMAQQQLDGEYVFRLAVAAKEAERKRIEAGGQKLHNEIVERTLTPAVFPGRWTGVCRQLPGALREKPGCVGRARLRRAAPPGESDPIHRFPQSPRLGLRYPVHGRLGRRQRPLQIRQPRRTGRQVDLQQCFSKRHAGDRPG